MNVAFRRHSRRSRRFYTDDGRALLVLPPHAGLASPSATLNQAVLRARQLITLLRRELDYNAFFNTLWLILNDVTIGFAVASFLNENDVNALLAHRLEPWLVHSIHDYLHWLDSWPAGLKLNTELSRLYAHSLALLSHAFSHFVRLVVFHFQFILLAASFTSYFGASFALALLIDFVSLLTVHITLSYAISRIVYRRMILAARSLFNLFRGKYLDHDTTYIDSSQENGTTFCGIVPIIGNTIWINFYWGQFSSLCLLSCLPPYSSTMPYLPHCVLLYCYFLHQ